MTDSDAIFLEGLECDCVIGIIPWERQTKQRVLLDIAFGVDAAFAARSDDISASVDYKEAAKRVKSFVEESSFKLIETLAEHVAELLLREFQVPWVEVTLQKPGAVTHAETVGVMIRRTRM